MGLLYQPLPTAAFTWRNDPVTFEGFPQFFLAHELAHQFWGQAVGWKSYHEQWISEALAQYFAMVYAERSRGRATLSTLLRQMRRSVGDHAEQGPIYMGYRLAARGDSQAFRAVVYNKGALVLHMLRRLVGDEPFFAALRAFYRESRFAKAGTEDFQRCLERETGLDLARFFRKWFLETALPSLSVGYAVSPGEARVVVEQRGEPFDLPLTVSLTYATGEREDVVVPVMAARVERVLPLRGQVRAVEVNVDGGTLAKVTVRRLR
jgi:aminopeptidase N